MASLASPTGSNKSSLRAAQLRDELYAMLAHFTQKRTAQEQPEALLGTGGTDVDVRTASAANSAKVHKQKNKPWKVHGNQLQHCPWNCGLVGGGLEMELACSVKPQSSTLDAASITLLEVLERVPGLIKSLPTTQWAQHSQEARGGPIPGILVDLVVDSTVVPIQCSRLHPSVTSATIVSRGGEPAHRKTVPIRGCSLPCNMLTAKATVAGRNTCRQARGLGLVVRNLLSCCRSERSTGYCRAFSLLPVSPCKLQQRKWSSAGPGQLLQMATSTAQHSSSEKPTTPREGFDPASMRGDYSLPGTGLVESDADPDPMKQFDSWFNEAVQSEQISEANAMCIATATPEGRPSNRMVLMKGYDQHGFKFYSNYSSRKGQELERNSYASLCFWWEPLHRSVRIEGQVEKLSAVESDAYFHSRPRGSQIGAVVSHQSSVLPHGRQELEQREQDLQQNYADEAVEIPRPYNWGGYLVVPSIIEFWHGKKSRIHDRLQYTREGNRWTMERLSP
ncbi:hypothetical protein WJX77_000113 [Trebouxia sp. C0004]